jgi:hypothetical protein
VAVCGPARADIPRLAAQSQDVADCRGSAGDRTGPPAGASLAEPGSGGLLACGTGGGDSSAGRSTAPLAEGHPQPMPEGAEADIGSEEPTADGLAGRTRSSRCGCPYRRWREGQCQRHRQGAAATSRQRSGGRERGAPEMPQQGHRRSGRSRSPKISPGQQETPPTCRDGVIEGVLRESGAKGTRTPDPLTASEGRSWP